VRLVTFMRPDKISLLGVLKSDTVLRYPFVPGLGLARTGSSLLDLLQCLDLDNPDTYIFHRLIERNFPSNVDLSLPEDNPHNWPERKRKWPLEQITLLAPLPRPTSLRDFYAFEQHMKTANENRGREVPTAWYEIPVFYFSNTSSVYGPEDTIPYPSYTEALDYELEVACVIGKEGRDIPADKAEEHIFGYMIFNDWSARDVQRQEMAVGLGPAKGKDFASSFGPYLVTPDELADRHTGRPGVYDLEMIARVNGVERSRGNWKDLYWSFGDMIARASQDVTLNPGDVIGSGTVGTGCLLELTKGQGPWLQPGDVVELEIERLGLLRNTIGEKREATKAQRHEEI
jgi:fumarylacetoacetate (FAA) hydrolase